MNAAFRFALQDKMVIATRTHVQSIHFSECFLPSLHIEVSVHTPILECLFLSSLHITRNKDLFLVGFNLA